MHPNQDRSKRTPELIDQLEAYIIDGYSNNLACKAIGIARQTLYNWLEQDPALGVRLDKARSASCQVVLRAIRDDPDWKAKAHWLSLVVPSEFAQSALLKKLVEDYGLADESETAATPKADEAETTA